MDYQDILADGSDKHYVVAENIFAESSKGEELVHPHRDVKIDSENLEYDSQKFQSILQMKEASKCVENMADMIKVSEGNWDFYQE